MKRSKPRSTNRKDGRGHWPPGKRRSGIEPQERRSVIARIRIACDRGLSLRAIAGVTGISDRTIRRWLSGEDHPLPEIARRVRVLPKARIG